MPKIRITETDNTGVVQAGEGDSVVYIPLKASAHVKPTLYSGVHAFDDAVEKGLYDKEGDNCKVARRLVSLGLPVLAEGFAGAGDIGASIKNLADKALYDIRFITLGSYADDADGAKALAEAVWDVAASRGDCVALIDVPSDAYSGGGVQDIRDFVEGLAVPEAGSNPATFGASFVPWISVNLGAGAENVHVPGSVGYLLAFAHSVQTNPLWYAAAGTFRGLIPELVSVDVEFTSAEVEMLQARAKDAEVGLDDVGDNVGIAVNPIAYVSPYGNIVWGNRTLRDNVSGETLPATAFLNVRVLATEIAKTVYRAARRYTFEQNNNVLWTNFKSMIVPLLDRMQSGNGINGYRIAKIPDEHRGRLKARITIIPIEAVEDFDIEITMENSIAEVTE